MTKTTEELNEIKRLLNSLLFLCDNYDMITDSVFDSACIELSKAIKIPLENILEKPKKQIKGAKGVYINYLRYVKKLNHHTINTYISCLNNVYKKVDLPNDIWSINNPSDIEEILKAAEHLKLRRADSNYLISLRSYNEFLRVTKNMKENNNA